MARIEVRQHRYTSVAQGLFPEQGRGFQTVGAAESLLGTDDLAALERASLYFVHPTRREAGDFPLKHTFFRLPSGAYALGRTRDSGLDSLGRAGNYYTEHLVVSEADLRRIGGDPFRIWEAVPFPPHDRDRPPGILPPLTLEIDATPLPLVQIPNVTWQEVARRLDDYLCGEAPRGRDQWTHLLVEEEAKTLPLLRGMFAALPTEERLALTFSTAFYRSGMLRPLFALVTVATPAEAPAEAEGYVALGQKSFLPLFDTSWLRDRLRSDRLPEVDAFNALVNRLRETPEAAREDNIPEALLEGDALMALWSRAGAPAVPLLSRTFPRLQSVIETSRPALGHSAFIAELMEQIAPSTLLASDATPDEAVACFEWLRQNIPAPVWKAWTTRWKDDPRLIAWKSRSDVPWWQRFRRTAG